MVLPPLSKISPWESKKGIVNRNKTKSRNPSAQLQDTVYAQGEAAQLRPRRQSTPTAKLELLQSPNSKLAPSQLERTWMG